MVATLLFSQDDTSEVKDEVTQDNLVETVSDVNNAS